MVDGCLGRVVRQAALLSLQCCPSPVELSTSPHRAHPQPLPAPTPNLIMGLHSTASANRSSEQPGEASLSGCKARCLAPPCCPQPKGGLRVACLHWRKRSSQPRNPGVLHWAGATAPEHCLQQLPSAHRRKWSPGGNTTFYP